jgi:redox-sensitive bicupin YhaK (pirin superfamily)
MPQLGAMTTATERRIARTVTTPPPAPGFIGEGHTAVDVVTPGALEASDPFVLLMDDRLDIKTRRRIGGAHPHAGIETVTLVLEGTLIDRDEGELNAGDVLWMTAGRGIIHNEAVEVGGKARILQLWVRLPNSDRSTTPTFQMIRKASAPVRTESGAVARLYSGSTGGLRSTTQNRAPVTLVDLTLDANATFDQELPLSYNGFVYVVDGSAVGGGASLLETGQVGWLDRPNGIGAGTLTLAAGERGARIFLYAGEPQHEPLVHHGPFAAGSVAEIEEMFHRYHAGRFESMSAIARRARREHEART